MCFGQNFYFSWKNKNDSVLRAPQVPTCDVTQKNTASRKKVVFHFKHLDQNIFWLIISFNCRCFQLFCVLKAFSLYISPTVLWCSFIIFLFFNLKFYHFSCNKFSCKIFKVNSWLTKKNSGKHQKKN